MKSMRKILLPLLLCAFAPSASAWVCYGVKNVNSQIVIAAFDPVEWERAGYEFYYSSDPVESGSVNGLFTLPSYAQRASGARRGDRNGYTPYPGVEIYSDNADPYQTYVRLLLSVTVTHNPYHHTDEEYWHLRMAPNWVFPCTEGNPRNLPLRSPLTSSESTTSTASAPAPAPAPTPTPTTPVTDGEPAAPASLVSDTTALLYEYPSEAITEPTSCVAYDRPYERLVGLQGYLWGTSMTATLDSPGYEMCLRTGPGTCPDWAEQSAPNADGLPELVAPYGLEYRTICVVPLFEGSDEPWEMRVFVTPPD